MKPSNRDWWRSTSVIRWRIPTRALVVAVGVLAVLLVAAIVSEATSSGIRPLPPATGSSRPEAVGNGQFAFSPRSARVTIGVPYRFTLYTHCGLDWPGAVDFDGSLWDPIGPGPASDGNTNPPPGYGNPFDRGVMTLLSPTIAQYRSSAGAVMRFSRHAGRQISFPCA